jgi:hypothetical protein
MLQQWNSPADSLTGFVEHECPRCHRDVELPLGALCTQCLRAIEARARRVALIVSLASTAAVALYVYLRMPDDQLARTVGGVSVAMWLVLSNLTVRRLMRQYHR